MKCPVCGAAELTRDIRDLPYTYKDETTVITAVTGEFCSVCGESILDPLESSRVMSEMSDFSTRPRYTRLQSYYLHQIIQIHNHLKNVIGLIRQPRVMN